MILFLAVRGEVKCKKKGLKTTKTIYPSGSLFTIFGRKFVGKMFEKW